MGLHTRSTASGIAVCNEQDEVLQTFDSMYDARRGVALAEIANTKLAKELARKTLALKRADECIVEFEKATSGLQAVKQVQEAWEDLCDIGLLLGVVIPECWFSVKGVVKELYTQTIMCRGILDEAAIEHSGRTLSERVKDLDNRRKESQRLLIKTKQQLLEN